MPLHITYRISEEDAIIPAQEVVNKNGPLSNKEIDGNFKSIKQAVDVLLLSGGFESGSYSATQISFQPTGDLTSTDVQTAIQEVNNDVIGKQATLVSGTNIKTVEGESLLGQGNVDLKSIAGQSLLGAGSIDFKTLDSTSIVGTGNIQVKTVNGESIFGSGDITIAASGGSLNAGDIKSIAGESLIGSGNVELKTINGETIIGTGDITVAAASDSTKQDVLVDTGVNANIKKIEGTSILGSGNIDFVTVAGTSLLGTGDIAFKTINGTALSGTGNIVITSGSPIDDSALGLSTGSDTGVTWSAKKINQEIDKAKNDLLGGAGTAYDTLKELADILSTGIQTGLVTPTQLATKQDLLKDSGAGANIKTIEGTSILGSGNIDFVSINGQSILGTGNIAISNINDATTGTGSTWSSTKLTAELSGKQATLVSGTTLKSIEGQSLLGAGDIDLISINGTSLIGNTNLVVSIIDDAGTGTNVALSASKVNTLLTAKQNTLVSGTNIKTLDSASLLGSGNISIKSFNGTSIIGTGNIDVAIIDDTVAASNSLWSSQKVNQELAKKQATLISGTGTGANMKSLGGNSLLGAGDISLATINGTSLIGTSINFAMPVINDSATSGTGLWSSQKVSTELALKGDVSYSGTGTFTNKTAESLILTKGYTETVYTTTTGATFELNPLNGSIQNLTLGANTTITLAAGFVSGQSVTIAVQTTTNTITWPAAILWIGGVPPVMDATRNNIFVVWKVGSSVYGLYVGKA